MLNLLKISVLGLGLTLSCGTGRAQDVEVGADIYRNYCASCHGIELTGNGPTSPALLVQPADLTGLSKGNGGVFPMQRVINRIDGRDPLVAHGSSMPVYGDFFDGVQSVAIKAPSGQPVLVSAPIADLVVFLMEMQE